jgi:adenosylcobinamide-GDP ribazoletransferase
MFKKEIHIFAAAIMFYSRIPLPKKNSMFSDEILHQSIRYFPLIGIIVGCMGGGVFWLSSLILPFQIAVILSMVATILLTGAFHEDGFADFCDGFGGGYTKERILAIMKDSSIGTYGAIGLLMMLFSKYLCLSNMKPIDLPLVLIAAHAFSRFLPVCLINTSTYARIEGPSKSKAIGQKGTLFSFCVALLFSVLALAFIPWKAVLLIAVLSLLLFVFFRWYVTRRLGGYTGDVLGALQQLSEIMFYLGFLIFQSHVG